MKKFRSAVAGILVVALGAGLMAGPSGSLAADEPKLNVAIFTVDGKQRIQVKRKLAVGVRCTKNCSVVVDLKLVVPGDVLKARLKGGLKAFTPKSPSMILNRPAIKYLKLTYPRARFSVKVTATDVSNGSKVVKQKVFRFRR